MSKNLVCAGQSFLNKVVECTGDIANAVEMAILNRINITDDIIPGSEVIPSAITNKSVVAFFNEFNRPATNISQALEIDEYGLPEGEFPIGL